MTDKITELRRLADGATSGPWLSEPYNAVRGTTYTICTRTPAFRHIGAVFYEDGFPIDATEVTNAAFIAATREAMPRLLDLIEVMEGALEKSLLCVKEYTLEGSVQKNTLGRIREALDAANKFRGFHE